MGFSSLSTKTSDWNYDVNAHHLFFGDKYKYNENEIGLNAKVGKMFGSQYIKLNADIQYIIPNINLDTLSTTLIGIHPMYEKESDEWKIILGVNTYYINDKDNAILYLFPVAQLNFNIYKDFISAYLGIKGDAKVNSYRELTMQNPYIEPGQYSPVSRTPLNIFAGLKANISKSISTNIHAAALSVKDMPFFINDTVSRLGNMFLVVNDDVDITKIYGEVNYDDEKKIRLQLKGNVYNYLTEKELKAWHKANFDVTLAASYNLQDKFLVNTEIFGVGERYALNVNDLQNPIKLDPYIDVNVGVEYRYNHLLSIFIDLYNLSGSSYDIWNQYPTYKFGLVAGFTYSL